MSGDLFERHDLWPAWAFRLPQWGMAVYLAIRHRSLTAITAANPYFEGGGLVGASKSQILSLLPKEVAALVPAWVVVRRHADVARTVKDGLSCMVQSKIVFPAVAKPDIGAQGKGVSLLQNEADLRAYAIGFPLGERFIVQTLCAQPVQATLLYVRQPNEAKGAVLSLTVKEIPTVTGDGVRTLRELILADPHGARLAHVYLPKLAAHWNDVIPAGETKSMSFAASRRQGAMMRDHSDRIDAAVNDRWDEIARAIPEFHFGSFDVCAPSLDDLVAGRHVHLLEIDGVGAEDPSVFVESRSVRDAYAVLWNRLSLAYDVGADNRRRGHKADSLLYLFSLWAREKAISRLYPASQ